MVLVRDWLNVLLVVTLIRVEGVYKTDISHYLNVLKNGDVV